MTQKVLTKIKKKDSDGTDDLLGDDHHSSSATEGVKRNPFHVDILKKNKKGKISHRKDEQKTEAMQCPGTSAHDNGISGEGEKESDAMDSNISHASDHGSENLNSNSGHVANGSHTDVKAENDQASNTVAGAALKSSSWSILNTLFNWQGRIKPFFITVAKSIFLIWCCTCLKLVRTCQTVSKCFLNLGNILLLALMVWLDCILRGMDSFVRMGTTSFFSIVWFSIFSLIAMIGILKFLLVLGIAVLIGVLVGFVISLLIVAVSGAFFLWAYGSFWTTSIVIFSAGLAFALSCQRLALLFTTVYSVYCAETYVGWLGVVLGLNLSFITSDAFGYYLKNNIEEFKAEQADGIHVEPHFFSSEAHYSCSDIGSGQAAGHSANSEITSEVEIVRLFNCTNHYSAFGLPRYQQVDVSALKREYRKKARLVHPDKNMGNEKAAQAFMKLQSAYEALLDPVKKKAYDDELRKEEMKSYFAQFRSGKVQNGSVPEGSAPSDGDGEEPVGESRKIACKKCGGSHMWFPTKKSPLKARWCQDCNDFHEAKDGEGWVEQSSHALLFGMLQKVDVPVAYVCVEEKVFDATEWFVCQGIRCPPNTHKTSFQVNTRTKKKHRRESILSHKTKASGFSLGSVTDEEFFEWLHNAMQSGMSESFSSFGGRSQTDSAETSPKTSPKNGHNAAGGGVGNSNRRRKRVKKFW